MDAYGSKLQPLHPLKYLGKPKRNSGFERFLRQLWQLQLLLKWLKSPKPPSHSFEDCLATISPLAIANTALGDDHNISGGLGLGFFCGIDGLLITLQYLPHHHQLANQKKWSAKPTCDKIPTSTMSSISKHNWLSRGAPSAKLSPRRNEWSSAPRWALWRLSSAERPCCVSPHQPSPHCDFASNRLQRGHKNLRSTEKAAWFLEMRDVKLHLYPPPPHTRWQGVGSDEMNDSMLYLQTPEKSHFWCL